MLFDIVFSAGEPWSNNDPCKNKLEPTSQLLMSLCTSLLRCPACDNVVDLAVYPLYVDVRAKR